MSHRCRDKLRARAFLPNGAAARENAGHGGGRIGFWGRTSPDRAVWTMRRGLDVHVSFEPFWPGFCRDGASSCPKKVKAKADGNLHWHGGPVWPLPSGSVWGVLLKENISSNALPCLAHWCHLYTVVGRLPTCDLGPWCLASPVPITSKHPIYSCLWGVHWDSLYWESFHL